MIYFHWIAGTILALAWLSRIVDAALGMPSVADVSRPEWDRNPVLPGGNPRVSIIVPARNEEETIEQALNTLLALDYDNYEVIAVNDRSTDSTGEDLETDAAIQSRNPQPSRTRTREDGAPGSFSGDSSHELPPDGWEKRMPCGRRRIKRPVTGCSSLTRTCCSSRIRCGERWLMRNPCPPIMWCCFRR